MLRQFKRKLMMKETSRERPGPGSAFKAIWAAWTVSIAGDEVSVLALPLAAAATLDASAFEMGVLSASGTLPFLLFGLLAGVWVDRHRRKPVLVASDVCRGMLLLSIPLAAILDLLTMAQLVIVAFAAGLFNVFFSVASLAILPAIVRRSRLVEANSRMEASQAVVRVATPGPAGLLIQAIGAPLAIGLDALSFLVSGLLVARAGITETAEASVNGARNLRAEIVEGLRAIFAQPLVRPVVLASATFVLFSGFQFAIYILFLVENLDLSAGWIGLLFATGSIASIASATLSTRLTARFGLGRALALAMTLRVAGLFVPPLAAGSAAIPVLLVSHLLFGFGTPLWNINQVSLRLAVTPDHLLGRMNATVRFVVWSMMPLGALAGGALGGLLGLRTRMLLSACLSLPAIAWVVGSGVARLQTIPAIEDQP